MKYDYICEKCELTVEEEHGMNESPVIYCPKCTDKMRRVFLNTNIIYKGNRWTRKSHDGGMADKPKKIRETHVKIKPEYAGKISDAQVAKDFSKKGKIVAKHDTRPSWSKKIDEKNS